MDHQLLTRKNILNSIQNDKRMLQNNLLIMVSFMEKNLYFDFFQNKNGYYFYNLKEVFHFGWKIIGKLKKREYYEPQ